MKYKRSLVAGVLIAVMALMLTSAARDSLITQSFVESELVGYILDILDSDLDDLEDEVDDALRDAERGKAELKLSDAQKEELALEAAKSVNTDGIRTVALEKGQRVTGPIGAAFILQSGEATVSSFTGNDVIDVTKGAAAAPGNYVTPGGWYMIGVDNGCGLTVTSDFAEVTLMDGAYTLEGYRASYKDMAEELAEMGLFRGSDKGFELERVPTRQEALIMLIRLLGEEDEALAYSGPTAFKDLTGWADGKKYIIYGENMKYTNGIAPDTFNQYGSASRHVYLTYVLRALGYSDAQGDFVWNTTSDDLAVELGLVSRKQLAAMEKDGFHRDHVALISYNALDVELKDGSMTLCDRLALSGDIR